MTKPKTMTVRELKEIMEKHFFPYPDAEVYFGNGDLSYYRPKGRGYKQDNKTPYLIQFEFNEVYKVIVDLDEE